MNVMLVFLKIIELDALFLLQMKWSGKVKEGAGKSTGETTELANSFLSRIGLVTRNCTKAARRERITTSAAFWNVRKLLELPSLISKSLSKVPQYFDVIERL